MALPDLTGQNIQDTYQRVLQTDGGTLRDGTGSLVTLTDITASGDISASGAIHGTSFKIGDATILQGGGNGINITLGSAGATGNISLVTHTGTPFKINDNDNIEITGDITASSDISSSIESTGSFGRLICTSISASTGQFDANTISLGGTTFSKTELDDLKQGKAINTTAKDLRGGDTNKTNIIRPDGVMHPNDDSTYIKLTTTGRIGTFVSGVFFSDFNLNGSNNYIRFGDGDTNLNFSGSINNATIDGGTF